jgi:hypothetical protein
MKMCKWRVFWRGLTLSFALCLLSTPAWAQENTQQNGPPGKESAFKGLPNLLASNSKPSMKDDGEKTERVKKTATEKDPSEKDPTAKKEPTPGGNPPPTPPGAEDPPLGFAGPKTVKPKNAKVTEDMETGDFVPVDDRWRIGFPEWNRHEDVIKAGISPSADYPYVKGRLINPYRQNILKGDYPVIGNNTFFVLSLESETFLATRRIPVPSDVGYQRPDSSEFFGRGGMYIFNQKFIIGGDLFKGAALGFKPADWRLHVNLTLNINYAHTRENGITRIDDRRGNTRRDFFSALQEAYGEYRIGDTTKFLPFLRGKGSVGGYNPYFDSSSIRAGIQLFNSDFRGFIFNDTNLGLRLFGNFASNRYQYNVAFFEMLEKDTNSLLNTFDSRNQEVFIANLYRQDTFKKGYTVSFSYHYNRDNASTHNDENGFPVRPAVFGFAVPHKLRTHYIGITSDGHFGTRLPKILFLNKIGGGLNLSTAFYQVFGTDSFNGLAGRKVDVNAQLAAAELSVDRDWLRVRTTFFYASGDDKPTDGTARGFDSILDCNNFAGGKFSFFNSVGFPFTNTTTQLSQPCNLLPSLRPSKIEGQANYVNPGIYVYNVGGDFDLTQKLRIISNINFIRFATTESLELALFQPQIEKFLGIDYHVGLRYRPKLNDNWVIYSGVSLFKSGAAFTSIFESNCKPDGPVFCGKEQGNKTLFNLFAQVIFKY